MKRCLRIMLCLTPALLALGCVSQRTGSSLKSAEYGPADSAATVEVFDRFEDGDLRERYVVLVGGNGDSVRHGPCFIWHENGAVLSEGTYRHGKLHGPFATYWKSGKKEAECVYVDGDFEGLVKWWYETGQIERQEHYRNNVRDGEYVKWYLNGKIQEESVYKNGILHGPFIKYDKQGNKVSEGEYKTGKLVSEKVY